MLAVRRLHRDDWPLYRELRLAALAESPAAFSGTLARALTFSDAAWRERLERADAGASCPLVATLDGVARGLAWAVPDRDRVDAVELFQMWVSPEARGRGAGRALVDACADWAASGGYAVLTLDCMRGNDTARRLYERCGFVLVSPHELSGGEDAPGGDAVVRMERDLSVPNEPTRGPSVPGRTPEPTRESMREPPVHAPTPEGDERRDLASTLDFLSASGALKDVLRSAHTNGGRRESTAEHTWRLCLWVVALGDRVADLDVRRLLELAVVHDLGEALGGDTPAPLQGREPDREARERRDLRTLTEPLPEPARTRLRALWEEYEAAETPEGRLVRGLDKLETMLQHADGTNPPDFDYAFNLDYGRGRTDATPLTRAIRVLVDEATRGRRDTPSGASRPGPGVRGA